MRILYWHRTLADGAEGVHIRAMVDAFRALGHEVKVADLAGGGGENRQRGLIERVRAGMPGVAFEAAAIGYNLPEYAHVRRAVREFGPDLVYARHAKFDVAALSAAGTARVPTVLEVNTVFTASDYHRFEPIVLGRAAAAMERRSFRLASLVTAVSTPLARQIAELAGVKAIVVPNGADPTLFDPAKADGSTIRARYGLGQKFVVGWTGILRDWHGLEQLINAVGSLPDARLLIVGDGPARSTVEAYAAAASVSSRLVVTGRVPHHEVPDHLAAMDAAVVADERTGVASPMKLLEYMSMGLTVLAPDAVNIRDLIRDGDNGLLFGRSGSHALEQRLAQVATGAVSRSELGARARRTIVTERNWRSIAQGVLQAVKQQSP